jgi:hypothetical protein
MSSVRRTCLHPFSFVDFITRLMPWLWVYNPTTRLSVLGNLTAQVQTVSTDTQTGGSLLVIDSDLNYLTREEAEQIITQFENLPQSFDRLLFWTGIPRGWVQQWADEHGMLTLTSAMGPLMDVSDQRCLVWVLGRKKWRKYVKGASGIFARYACARGIVRVLTLPPSHAEFLRPMSSYRTIEEPVLKGLTGHCCAVQINSVHLLAKSKELEYQIWPEDQRCERLDGGGTLEFRLPPRILRALKAPSRKLGSKVASSTAPQTVNGSLALQGSGEENSFPAVAQHQGESEHQRLAQALKECQTQTNKQSPSRQQSNTKNQPQSKKPLLNSKQPQTNSQPQTNNQPPISKQISSSKRPQTDRQPQCSKKPQSSMRSALKVGSKHASQNSSQVQKEIAKKACMRGARPASS